MNRWVRRLVLVLASTLLGLVAAEVGLRLRARAANQRTLQAALAEAQSPNPRKDAGLGNLIRLSPNDRIIYELQPELTGRTFRGTQVSTDEHGFRRMPPVPADGRPLVTILGLGDSIQFGHGVQDEDTYLYQLQLLLQEGYPACRWRVINSAVPGYNTCMEVETLTSKGLAFEPQIVIWNLVGNDLEPPFFVRREVQVWNLQRSFLVDLMLRTRELEVYAKSPPPRGFVAGHSWYEDPQQSVVPERYQALFGQRAFEQAVDRLLRLSENRDFRLLCFTTYEWDSTEDLLAYARGRGIPHSTLMPELRDWMQEHMGVPFAPVPYSRSKLVATRRNPHPSPLQHRMAAERLLQDLAQLGWLSKYGARTTSPR